MEHTYYYNKCYSEDFSITRNLFYLTVYIERFKCPQLAHITEAWYAIRNLLSLLLNINRLLIFYYWNSDHEKSQGQCSCFECGSCWLEDRTMERRNVSPMGRDKTWGNIGHFLEKDLNWYHHLDDHPLSFQSTVHLFTKWTARTVVATKFS